MQADHKIRVKLCGLKTSQEIETAARIGAAYVGFVFFPKSPRNISYSQAAQVAKASPAGLAKVALVVNPTDADLDALTDQVPLDMIQLHGKETPERVAEVRLRTGLPVMKAIGIATPDDIAIARTYAGAADQLLLDAKPSPDELPGGNGLSFDWKLLAGVRWYMPWMLAGGLTPDNVAQAVALTGAQQVDVSSGIESSPGQKDLAKMEAFVSAAQTE